MKNCKNTFLKAVVFCLLLAFCIPVLYTGQPQAASVPKKPSFTVSKRTKTKATLKIDKKDKVTGYQIYMKKGKKGKYRFCSVAFTRTCTIEGLKPNSEYYVKIRSYRTQGNSIKRSSFSAVKKIGKYSKPSEDKDKDSSEEPPVEQPEEPSVQEQYADEVLALVNEERAKVGLSPLVLDEKLNTAAMIRANEIVEKFDHIRPNGTSCFTVLQENNISYNAVGENIAEGQATPAQVMTGWMNSEGHRANILSPKYGKLGIGFVKSSSGYQYYWVQIFTD